MRRRHKLLVELTFPDMITEKEAVRRLRNTLEQAPTEFYGVENLQVKSFSRVLSILKRKETNSASRKAR